MRAQVRTGRRRRSRVLLAAVALCGGGLGAVGTGTVGADAPSVELSAAAVAPGGLFVPASPTRILDTRSGIGGKLGPLGSYELQIVGTAGIPSDAMAVALNVTVTDATEISYVTVQPTGQPPQLVSSVSFSPGETVANLVTAKIGADGKVWISNAAGTAHVVADLVGWFVPGGGGSGAQGPAGPAGPQGPAGVQGIPGIQGIPGLAGSPGTQGIQGIQGVAGLTTMMGSSGTAVATTIAGGLQGTLALVPLNGYVDTAPTASLVGGLINMTGLTAPARAMPQPIPAATQIHSISAHLELNAALALVGTTLTPSVQIYAIAPNGNTATPVAGAIATCTPLTGVLAIATPAECSVTGLSINVPAGSRLFSVVSATATGITLITTLSVSAAVTVT